MDNNRERFEELLRTVTGVAEQEQEDILAEIHQIICDNRVLLNAYSNPYLQAFLTVYKLRDEIEKTALLVSEKDGTLRNEYNLFLSKMMYSYFYHYIK